MRLHSQPFREPYRRPISDPVGDPVSEPYRRPVSDPVDFANWQPEQPYDNHSSDYH